MDGARTQAGLQEDPVHEPDVVLHPPPPKISHPNNAHTRTNERDYEPMSGASTHITQFPQQDSPMQHKTHSGKFTIRLTNAAPRPFPKSIVCKVENVPGNRTNPANKIHVKNDARRL